MITWYTKRCYQHREAAQKENRSAHGEESSQ